LTIQCAPPYGGAYLHLSAGGNNMDYNYLGKTNLKVSKVCFGSLTIGPLQANLSLKQGSKIIRHALERGVNFIDTAEIYDTYPYIREALKGYSKEVIIATKSYAYEASVMKESLEKARRELDRDVIDIFLLHEQESILTIKGHWQAVEYLLKAKAQGLVRAIGLSTHTVAGVKGALEIPEMEIIHPLINYQGLGILDGTRDEMLSLLKQGKSMGKGIYGMKPIGGGNLLAEAEKALTWALQRPELDAVAVGMQSISEVNINLALAEGREPDPEDLEIVKNKVRYLLIEDYCEGCGACVAKCPQKALQIIEARAKVEKEKCLLCGYCAGVCPYFAIKVL